MLIKTNFAIGESKEFTEENDFFRVLEAAGTMTLIFYFNGKEVGRAEKVKEGFAEKFLIERFNRVVIKNEHTAAQDIQFVARLGHEIEYNKSPTGDVNVIKTSTTHAPFDTTKIPFTNGTNIYTTPNTAAYPAFPDRTANPKRRKIWVECWSAERCAENGNTAGPINIAFGSHNGVNSNGGIYLKPGERIELCGPYLDQRAFFIWSKVSAVASFAEVLEP